jgi:nitroimidazol reductase NimA-like FMN-containing flavoprotein (pyridoxamine 5'-phosphate oxidase superfamily)
MALPRELSLSPTQIDEIMGSQWNLRVATLGPGSRINLTPMWFGWGGGAVYFYGRGQKIVNLRRNPTCTILVDRNERFPELQGIMLQGAARVLEDAQAEADDPHLAEVQAQMGVKYDGGHGQPAADAPGPFAATARGRNRRWVVLAPAHMVTWDNFKLPRT